MPAERRWRSDLLEEWKQSAAIINNMRGAGRIEIRYTEYKGVVVVHHPCCSHDNHDSTLQNAKQARRPELGTKRIIICK